MAHRTSKGGSLRIDRVFPGVGRIAMTSGTSLRTEYDKRDALLTRLYDQGRFDLLRAIKVRTYSITEVYAADREDRLGELSGDRAILGRPLWATVAEWVGPTPGQTRRRYRVSFKALRERAGLSDTATIEALGTVDWNALKARWPKSDGDWFHLRAAVSHFLAEQLGNGRAKRGVRHPWRMEVMDTDNFPSAKAAERVPDLDVPTFWRIVNQTPDFVRASYVTIAYLGLRVGEYLRLQDTDLLPATKQVRIPGTKTAGSAATLPVAPEMWPWITAAVPSPLAYKWLRTYWVRARNAVGAGDVRLHDLRHLTAMTLVDAGRSEASVRQTMRHSNVAMTAKYAKRRDRGENAQAMANALLATG